MTDCTVCGKPIIDESYVVANRRVYHLHHEDDDHIGIEEYEKIIATLKQQLAYQAIEIEEKNKVILSDIESIKDLQEAKNIRVKTVQTLRQEIDSLKEDRNDLFKQSEKTIALLEEAETKYTEISELNEANMLKLITQNESIALLENELVECANFKKKIKELGLSDDSEE